MRMMWMGLAVMAGVAAVAMAEEGRPLLKVRPQAAATLKAVKPTIYEKTDVAGLTAEQRKKVEGIRVATDKKIAAVLAEEQKAIAEAEGLRDGVDSLADMGEMDSLRLQMVMDRRSKMMSTLSNVMKKMGETSEGIIQNMK